MIRPRVDEDVEAILGIYLEAATRGQDFLPAEFWEADIPEIRNELLPTAETWVVVADGDIVAFVSLHEDLIGGLFTLPAHQGRGHGKALVEHVHRLHDPLFVEVFEANAAAVAFYRHRGFESVEQSIEPKSGLPVLTMRLGNDG